jgi:hypothetical protein
LPPVNPFLEKRYYFGFWGEVGRGAGFGVVIVFGVRKFDIQKRRLNTFMKSIHEKNGKDTTTATFTEFHPTWVQMDLFRWAGITDESSDSIMKNMILDPVWDLFGKAKFFDESAVGFAVRNGH